MSLTRTYQVAATARSKLGSEASRPEHRLRHLVGHANLLDTLMLELAEAERQQEQWFDETVRNAAASASAISAIPPSSESIQHVRWADTGVEDSDEDAIYEDGDDDDDNDNDNEIDNNSGASPLDFPSDYDDDAEELLSKIPLVRVRSPPVRITSKEVSASSSDEEEEEDDVYDEDEDIYYPDDEYDEAHALVRTHSRSNPPELIHDDEASCSSSDDEEDEAVSPPPLSKQEQQRLSGDLGLAYHLVKADRHTLRPGPLVRAV